MNLKTKTLFLTFFFLIILLFFPVVTFVAASTPLLVLGGTQGSLEGVEFNEPEGVAFSPQGLLFCSDTNNHRIQVYHPNGTYLRNITGFNWVQGLAFGPDGLLYVVDFLDHCIKKYFENGTYISQFGEQGEADGQFQENQGLGIDPDTGDIYVSDSVVNRVQKFSPEGNFLLSFGESILEAPESIVVNSSKVYVCSEGTGTIEVFDTAGMHLDSFGHGEFIDDPEGITIDHAGNILVNNEGKGKISIFNPNGTHVADWGAGYGSGTGQMQGADGLAYDMDNYRLAVADQGNFRILVFDWDQALIEVTEALQNPSISTTVVSSTGTVETTDYSSVTILVSCAFIVVLLKKKRRKTK